MRGAGKSERGRGSGWGCVAVGIVGALRSECGSVGGGGVGVTMAGKEDVVIEARLSEDALAEVGAFGYLENLSPVQAGCVRTLVADLRDRLRFVSILTTDAEEQRKELSNMVGDDIHLLIDHQRNLESDFEKLVLARTALKGVGATHGQQKMRKNQQELAETALKLRDNTMQLCKNLKDYPNLNDNMRKMVSERLMLHELCEGMLLDLSSLNFMSLVRYINEDRMKRQVLNEVMEEERKLSSEVQGLKDTLVSEQAEADEDIRKRKSALGELREKISKMTNDTGIDLKYKEADATAEIENRRAASEIGLRDLEARKAELLRTLEIEEQATGKMAKYLHKRYSELLNNREAWNNKFEDDTSNKDKELEKIRGAHRTDVTRLRDVEKSHDGELEKKTAFDAAELYKIVHRADIEREAELHDRAASRIQHLFHVWQTIKDTYGKKKKKGKGGKKK